MSTPHHTCAYSHLILSGRCACQYSAKDCVAEKEFGACLKESAANDCESLYQNLRKNSDFALNTHHQSNLSVGQQAKIKMGGLLALQEKIDQGTQPNINDIFELVQKIKKRYKSFANLPFSVLMPKIAKFKFRKKP